MTRGLYTIASGGVAALARLDAAAQNLANVGTAGYRAERVVFTVLPLGGGARAAASPILGRTATQTVQTAVVRDFSPGPVRATGNPLDVALTGRGFFAVATRQGERYTRNGSFALDPDGHLVTARGERVQGEQGDVRLPVTGGDVRIADDGTIRVDDVTVGRLKVVDFGDAPRLVPEGASLFAPATPDVRGRPLDAADVRLVQGALEGANIDAVASLTELVDVTRGYEAYMNALKRLDELAGRSINEVGRV